jgi:O-antigen chain-terminating methyltransferase|tara:strand:+ start:492 stop:1187 length:696 start_codon:yes stop_codon:yes gene_type:complete
MKRYIKRIYGIMISLTYKSVYLVISYLPAFKFYQPIYGKEEKSKAVSRACIDRWKAIVPFLREVKGSVLDIGCNIGYFSFMASKEGCISFGVEADNFNITCCHAIKAETLAKNCMFMKKKVDMDFVRKMPFFDVILSLSVFHHWVKSYGDQQAIEMMKILASKCRAMIFETGQSNESGTKWHHKLFFMGKNPDKWIQSFLYEIGFQDVRIIGIFPTGLTDVDRYLFLARKT